MNKEGKKPLKVPLPTFESQNQALQAQPKQNFTHKPKYEIRDQQKKENLRVIFENIKPGMIKEIKKRNTSQLPQRFVENKNTKKIRANKTTGKKTSSSMLGPKGFKRYDKLRIHHKNITSKFTGTTKSIQGKYARPSYGDQLLRNSRHNHHYLNQSSNYRKKGRKNTRYQSVDGLEESMEELLNQSSNLVYEPKNLRNNMESNKILINESKKPTPVRRMLYRTTKSKRRSVSKHQTHDYSKSRNHRIETLEKKFLKEALESRRELEKSIIMTKNLTHRKKFSLRNPDNRESSLNLMELINQSLEKKMQLKKKNKSKVLSNRSGQMKATRKQFQSLIIDNNSSYSPSPKKSKKKRQETHSKNLLSKDRNIKKGGVIVRLETILEAQDLLSFHKSANRDSRFKENSKVRDSSKVALRGSSSSLPSIHVDSLKNFSLRYKYEELHKIYDIEILEKKLKDSIENRRLFIVKNKQKHVTFKEPKKKDSLKLMRSRHRGVKSRYLDPPKKRHDCLTDREKGIFPFQPNMGKRHRSAPRFRKRISIKIIQTKKKAKVWRKFESSILQRDFVCEWESSDLVNLNRKMKLKSSSQSAIPKRKRKKSPKKRK